MRTACAVSGPCARVAYTVPLAKRMQTVTRSLRDQPATIVRPGTLSTRYVWPSLNTTCEPSPASLETKRTTHSVGALAAAVTDCVREAFTDTPLRATVYAVAPCAGAEQTDTASPTSHDDAVTWPAVSTA